MIFHDWKDTEIIPDAFAWYQYQQGGSAGQIIYDSIGDKHLQADVSNAPVLTENVLAGQPAWYFDGTKDPLVYSGSVTIKHAFVLASQADATFDGYQGLLTGETTGDVLVGEDAAAKFFDLGLSGFEYIKSGTTYADNNQLAPVSGNFGLLEVTSVDGITLDGIQVGQQKADVTRKWEGHFVEMILFDRVLDRDELRRVRLYFNIKFGEWRRGLPFYAPTADLVPTVGPSRNYAASPDYPKITDSWEYEDGTKDFNEVADDAPLHFEYAYPAVPKNQLPIFDEFYNQARLINPFYFKDNDDIVWTNIRVEDYNRNHEAHKRWRHDVAFRFVGYNSVGTYEGPIVVEAPGVPTGLALEVLSDSEILVTWSSPPDTEAPSAPVLSSAVADSDTEVTMIWAASTDDVAVTGYDTRIDGGAWTDRGLVLTYQYTGLTASTEYDFEVRAYDAAGNHSVASNLISETTEAPGAFSPADLPDIGHWWKATDLALADNDPVSTWADAFGSADYTAAGGVRPTYKANAGDPYVQFDGTDDTMAATISGLGLDFSVVLIWERVADSGGYARAFETNGDNIIYFQDNSNDTQLIYYSIAGGLSRNTPAVPSGFMATYVERVGTAGKYRLDGSETTGTVTIGTTPTTAIKLGSNISGTENGNIRVKEMIICSDAVTGADFTALAAYISAEYGLTL